MTADPLLAELWPDGTFGGARPRRIPAARERRIEAEQHLAVLAAEVASIDGARRRARTTRTPATTERTAA